MEELEPTTFCTYWPKNPAFVPKRVLLRRLFFINEDRTKYVSVGFYPARDYLPMVEFGFVRGGDGPKILNLSDEQLDAMAETCLCYGTPCLVAHRLLGSQVRDWCLSFRCVPQLPYGSSIRRIAIHFSYFTRYRLSIAHV